MIAILTTHNPIKLSAAQALLSDAGIDWTVFDAATGSLWTAAIPRRLMVSDDDAGNAAWTLRGAGWIQAGDGDWDLAPTPAP